MYDVIIIGSGPAGISAGLYTVRGNLKTLILYYNHNNITKEKKIENYYGFENGISGQDLYEKGIKQAKNLGIDLKNEKIIKIELDHNNMYKLITSKAEYNTKAVILALGANKKTLQIDGIQDLEGKGISYCAICDGFFYKNKEVSVIGSGRYALSETNDLINIAKRITILTDGQKAPEFRAENVDVITKPIERVIGDNKVEKIVFKDNSELKTDGIFIAQGVASASDFARKLGIIIKNGNIVVNENMETNLKGVYACGDCTGGLLQISKAVYEGTIAGLSVIKYCKSNF